MNTNGHSTKLKIEVCFSLAVPHFHFHASHLIGLRLEYLMVYKAGIVMFTYTIHDSFSEETWLSHDSFSKVVEEVLLSSS